MPKAHVVVLVPCLLLGGCAASLARIAATIPMAGGSTTTLRLRAPETKDVGLELWNRGPGKVRFRRLLPAGDATAAGVLEPGGGEFRWQATTAELLIELAADDAGATVAYTVRTAGSISVEVGTP